MILEYFSYSGIQSFKKCPAQFKYRYIDKIYKKDEGIEAFMGKRVHESIEYLYQQYDICIFDKLSITYAAEGGHLNIIKRSLKIVDELIIGLADNENKSPLLTIND